MTEYQFTQDWFHWAPGLWEQLIPMLPDRKKFLEIGSYEGRSMAWIVENMLGEGAVEASVVCIDTWEGSEEHTEATVGPDLFSRFCRNKGVAEAKYWAKSKKKDYRDIVEAVMGRSDVVLPHILANWKGAPGSYDFIYIDGSHTASGVLTDACMAWPLLKPLGIMVFDDYTWGEPRDILHRPKLAVDCFMNIFAEEIELIHMGYQVALRKKG